MGVAVTVRMSSLDLCGTIHNLSVTVYLYVRLVNKLFEDLNEVCFIF